MKGNRESLNTGTCRVEATASTQNYTVKLINALNNKEQLKLGFKARIQLRI